MTTIDDLRSTTFAAIPHDDLTVAEAWASSPLGDPSIEDGSLSEPAELENDWAAEVPAKPRAWRTNALVGSAVVAGAVMVAGLALMLIEGTGSNKQKPAVVVPNSSVGSVTPQAPSAVSPSPIAPAPVATPPDAGQPSAGPVSGGGAPVWTGPAPAPAIGATPASPGAPADPGTPPPPSVAVIPVPVPIYVPPDHDGSQQGGGTQQGGGHPPIVHGPVDCIPCHQPVQQQPVHPQPIQPQPVHPQPIHPQPVQQQPIQHH